MLLVGKLGVKIEQDVVGGWIILKLVLERIGWGGMDFISQAKDRDR
jgi:hypothetical protein